MGAPMVDDGQLYSFFKEYRADIKAGRKTPTSFGNNPKSTLIEETSGMRQDPPASVREEASSPYEIDDDKVLRHITTCFTAGIWSPKNLARLKAPTVMSRLSHMHEEAEAYDFFLFWLQLPTNEWLDAFLFEVAASWKEVSDTKKTEEKLKVASYSINDFKKPSFDRLKDLLNDKIFDEKSSFELSDSIDRYTENVAELQKISKQMRSIIQGVQTPNLLKNDEAELTDQFFENGYLMRRVNENKKDIGAVRYAFKDLELGDER